MRDFLTAARLLLLDLASTIFFVVLFFVTHDVILSVGLGIALGLAQIATRFARRKPIDAMEWLSLFLVVAAGTATLLTDDPRFLLLKPSVICAPKECHFSSCGRRTPCTFRSIAHSDTLCHQRLSFRLF